IGSFQRLFYHDDTDGIDMLARHVARHYYADANSGAVVNADAETADLLVELLQAIAGRIAITAGNWMAAGFVHGVLNTDNYNVTGESFDYGPWRFLPKFDPGLTAAYFDQTGRYAYGRQPDAAMWAVCRLADCFVKLVPKSTLEDCLHGFYATLESALAKAVQRRLGIAFDTTDDERDAMLARQFFTAAKASDHGFDQIFHDLFGGKARSAGYDDDVWVTLLDILSGAHLARPNALQHPHFNQTEAVSLTIDEVEALWAPIAAADDWQPLVKKITAIRTMRAALDGAAITAIPQINGGALSAN
ncbi:MAG: protein adenylyltransferase SelO family protein, partial [Candidatus Puniceispirillaceae bacterium]